MGADWASADRIGTGDAATLADVVRAVKLVARRGVPALVVTSVGIASVSLGLQLLMLGLKVLNAWLAAQESFLVLVTVALTAGGGFLTWGLSFLLGAAAAGQLRSVRALAFEGAHAVTGVGDVVGRMRERVLPTLAVVVIVGVVVGVGLFCCVVPGLVAMVLLYPAVYLVTAADVGVVEALVAAPRLTARNVVVILVLGCLALVAAVVVGTLSMLSRMAGSLVLLLALQTPLAEPLVDLTVSGVFGVVGVLIAYPMLALSGGVLVAMESADRGVPLAED